MTACLPEALCHFSRARLQVAQTFSSKYYPILEKHPEVINKFYKDESTLTVSSPSILGEDGTSVGAEVRQCLLLSLPRLSILDDDCSLP